MPSLQMMVNGYERNPLLFAELIYLVYKNSSRRDSNNLAMTCKTLFRSIIPWAWGAADSLERLLSLIPGTTVT
ncbi:hypothetical protein B0J17DRAFT_96951 [Rhizoctonia solani]|nr:hypothetical protein B0J17DRAFT_96951 [Rhizoctonia solani]